jgi:uncharacterized protein (TIGR02217 family)
MSAATPRGFTPLVYPKLNLAYSVIKRPTTSAGVTQAASGRETRISYWSFPMWEWDLTYEYLPDDNGPWVAGKTSSDIKTLMGLFGQVGMFYPFLYEDDDDNSVQGQWIGNGDGATTSFTLIRSYGAGGFGTYEPIGRLNYDHPINVYVDGNLQPPDTWDLNPSIPYANLVVFHGAPPQGSTVTMDFRFHYLVRFKDNSLEFEKIFDRLWSIKRATLVSLKGF